MINHRMFRSFYQAKQAYRTAFMVDAKEVKAANWQGTDVSKKPEMVTHELFMQSFSVDLAGQEDLDSYQRDIGPNLPWADDHFEERVCGWPINPGVEWANWPWAKSAEGHLEKGMFNHNYMERLWPKIAGMTLAPSATPEEFRTEHDIYRECCIHLGQPETNWGIRGGLNDLMDLVHQLANDPNTRQAVIPLFMHEDVGTNARKPCTLLYQFIRRDGRLHLYYPLRSCDFVRHWQDDCYMAVRLLLWVIQECRKINPADWNHVRPGEYHMHMTSFHIFENDRRTL